nr:uncharacterized protein LOC105856074 [Microcebus murinus]
MPPGRAAGESGRLRGSGRWPGGSRPGSAAAAAAGGGSAAEPPGGGRSARSPLSARCPAARPGPLLQALWPECAGAARPALSPLARPRGRGPGSGSPTRASVRPVCPLFWLRLFCIFMIVRPIPWPLGVRWQFPNHWGVQQLGGASQQLGAWPCTERRGRTPGAGPWRRRCPGFGEGAGAAAAASHLSAVCSREGHGGILISQPG